MPLTKRIEKYLTEFNETANKFRLIGHEKLADELENKLSILRIVLEDYSDIQNICNLQSKVIENYEKYSGEIDEFLTERYPDLEPSKELIKTIDSIYVSVNRLTKSIYTYEMKSVDKVSLDNDMEVE